MVFIVLCFTDSYDMRSNQGWLWGLTQKTWMGNCSINLLTQFLQTALLSLGRKNEDVRYSVILNMVFLMPRSICRNDIH